MGGGECLGVAAGVIKQLGNKRVVLVTPTKPSPPFLSSSSCGFGVSTEWFNATPLDGSTRRLYIYFRCI